MEDNLPGSVNSFKDGASSQLKLTANFGQNKEKLLPEDLFFSDGVRIIDYVLVYKEKSDKWTEKREAYEKALKERGLELEHDEEQCENLRDTVFCTRVHAPWDVLCEYADIMNIKVPILKNDLEEEEEGCCGITWFDVDEDIIPPEPNYFTAPFDQDHQELYIIEDKDTFFTRAQRFQIVFEILKRARYDKESNKFGITALLSNGTYEAAYPLHEGRLRENGDDDDDDVKTSSLVSDRKILFETWARFRNWYKFQPLDLIRKYFGEKIAIYFTWLGYYTVSLIPAALVGLACFLYGAFTLSAAVYTDEICDENDPSGGALIMCPQCDQRCPYWYLHESCFNSKLTYIFDNGATVFFAIFMSVWATVFLELWKRKQHIIAWDWDVQNFEEDETVRPAYEAAATEMRLDPITQQMVPIVSSYKTMTSKMASFVSLFFILVLVLAAAFGVIVYRIIINAVLYSNQNEIVRTTSSIVTSITASMINLVVIMVLSKIYKKLAVWFTDMECPRTYTEYEDSFTFKMFLFQFTNYYSSLVYIAFFKGKFYNYPGETKYNLFGNYRLDQCDPAGCMVELFIQLAIIMGGNQIINNFMEILLPPLIKCLKTRIPGNNPCNQWEYDYLLKPYALLSGFNEYLELVIQYGFVTLFVAAFPLAPLFALLNNILEIRIDAFKYIATYRRPLTARAQDIGAWHSILKGVTYLAVVFNAFIIAYTSDFIQRLVYMYAYSDDKDLIGYINNSLSVFATKDFTEDMAPDYGDITANPELANTTLCRYRGYRYPAGADEEYMPTLQSWHVTTAKLAFIVAFEHVVFFISGSLAAYIPDVPGEIKYQVQREKYLTKEAFIRAQVKHNETDTNEELETRYEEHAETVF